MYNSVNRVDTNAKVNRGAHRINVMIFYVIHTFVVTSEVDESV